RPRRGRGDRALPVPGAGGGGDRLPHDGAQGGGRMNHELRRGLSRVGHVAVLAAFVAFLAFPFYWMVLTTFKQTRDLVDTRHNPFVFNLPPTLENLRVLFHDTLFGQWILNTLYVGVLVTGITLLLAVPAGYALARL